MQVEVKHGLPDGNGMANPVKDSEVVDDRFSRMEKLKQEIHEAS